MFMGIEKKYSLPIFHCSEDSSVKSAKEIFDRSLKQLYIVVAGLVAGILIFLNDKDKKDILYIDYQFFYLVCFQ